MKFTCSALVCAFAVLAIPSIASAQSVTGNACTLLTPAEAGQALGSTVIGNNPGAASNTATCFYSPSGKHDPKTRMVILTLLPVSMFDTFNHSMGNSTAKPAPGLGNGAYFVQNPVGTTVHVRKGDRSFTLRVDPAKGDALTQAQIEAMELALGQKVLARL